MFFGKTTDPGRDPGYPEFPLDLRIGAIMAVELAETLRFEGLPLSWRPTADELLVDGLAALDLFDLHIVRAYATRGDERLLFQFNLDASGALLDCNIFSLLETIRPSSADDWALWLDPGGLIGGADLNAPNGEHYLRQWGDGDYATPVEAEEAIYTDAKAPPRRVSHRMMLYGRDVDTVTENLLLSADTDPQAAVIRAWVGLDVSSVGVRIY